jgi:hypothetical protein
VIDAARLGADADARRRKGDQDCGLLRHHSFPFAQQTI